jgi:hypothetical protein
MPTPISTKKWRATRPVSCKASGVGDACDDYAKYCLPATDLKKEEDVNKARDTVLKLQMALRDALKKIKPKDKEKVATEALIDDWLKQIKQYQVGIAAIVKKESDDKKAYAEVLRGYGERKNALLKHCQDAATRFDRVIEEAEKMAQQADQLAKAAHAQPAKANQCVAAIQQLLDKVKPFQDALDKLNTNTLAKFDPHRSTDKPSDLGLQTKDVEPFAAIFTQADNLRKKMVEQAKDIKPFEDSISSSLEEARVATLPDQDRLAAYLKLATDLQVKVRVITSRFDSKALLPKGILDGDYEYKDSFYQNYVSYLEKTPNTPDKAEARKNAKTRAKLRYEQVHELEAGLKASLANGLKMAKRGIEGIPKPVQSNPAVREQITGTTTALQEAKAYYDRWVKARTDAEQPYIDALKAIDKA